MAMVPIREDAPRGKTRKEFCNNIRRGYFRPYVVECEIAEGFDIKLDAE